jgi:hypothetical protein
MRKLQDSCLLLDLECENGLYCHVTDYRRILGLTIGFIGPFHTARGYTLLLLFHTDTLMSTVTSSPVVAW